MRFCHEFVTQIGIAFTTFRVCYDEGRKSHHFKSMTGKRILVVDDEERMVRFIRLNLEHDGFHVIEAYNSQQAMDRLRETLPAEVLVLPAHGKPFRGALPRLGQLIDEHERGLEKLRRLCREPRRAVDVFPALFKARIDERNLIMATGEAVAHFNYLIEEGEIDRETDQDGVNWYRSRT